MSKKQEMLARIALSIVILLVLIPNVSAQCSISTSGSASNLEWYTACDEGFGEVTTITGNGGSISISGTNGHGGTINLNGATASGTVRLNPSDCQDGSIGSFAVTTNGNRVTFGGFGSLVFTGLTPEANFNLPRVAAIYRGTQQSISGTSGGIKFGSNTIDLCASDCGDGTCSPGETCEQEDCCNGVVCQSGESCQSGSCIVVPQCANRPSGLIQWFNADEEPKNSCFHYDNTCLHYNVTLDGLVNKAYDTTDVYSPHVHVSTGFYPTLNKNANINSIEFWYKPAAHTGSSSSIIYSDDFTLQLSSTALSITASHHNNEFDITDYKLNDWNHVAVVYDDPVFKVYMDGELKGSVTSIADSSLGNDIEFGLDKNYYDELSLYDRPLNELEIQSIFNAGIAGKCKGCGDSLCESDETCSLDFCCDGEIKDLWGSSLNCGSCGNVCNTGETCEGGICIPDSVQVQCEEGFKYKVFDSPQALDTYWPSSAQPEGSLDGEFNASFGIATDSLDNVYVVDSENDRIQKFRSNGEFILSWGTSGSNSGEFFNPKGVEVDKTNNFVYVFDAGNRRVQKFSLDGTFILEFGFDILSSSSSESSVEVYPYGGGIAVDQVGDVYVLDRPNDRVLKFSASGDFILEWGSNGYEDGQFSSLQDIAIDSQNNVYVCQVNGKDVKVYTQKFTSTGTFIEDFARGNYDGRFPLAIEVDNDDNVYFMDSNNAPIIKKFSSSGEYLGGFASLGSESGEFNKHLNSAGGGAPMGRLAFDSNGDLYATDSGGNRVIKFGIDGGCIIDSDDDLCVAGETDEDIGCCNGVELDLQTDNNNCGSCNNACTNGATCQAGTCQGGCTPQTEICDNLDNDCDTQIDEDFNLQTDNNNCGACGNVCTNGDNCVAGVCDSPTPIVERDCNECGDGLFNNCDQAECSAIKDICLFNPGLIMGGECCEDANHNGVCDYAETQTIARGGWKEPGGNLNCTLRKTSCLVGEVRVLDLYERTNSHAAKPHADNTEWVDCCGGNDIITNECEEDGSTFLKTSSVKNAHAAIPEFSNWDVDICIGGHHPIECEATTQNCIDAGHETCVISLYESNNSHVAECYSAGTTINICCTEHDIPVPECGNEICERGENNQNCVIDCPEPPTCGDGQRIAGETDINCRNDTAPPGTCATEPTVGNTACEDGEDLYNCAEDCNDPNAPACGNDRCEVGETKINCPVDCPESPDCNDGTCQETETPMTCPEDCNIDGQCGNGICDEGDDYISCPADCDYTPQCGNRVCESRENSINCPRDCPPPETCGNGRCDHLETAQNCPQECPTLLQLTKRLCQQIEEQHWLSYHMSSDAGVLDGNFYACQPRDTDKSYCNGCVYNNECYNYGANVDLDGDGFTETCNVVGSVPRFVEAEVPPVPVVPGDSCTNKVKDDDETGVDCGGACDMKCGENIGCESDDDCATNFCNPLSNTCTVESCTDNVKNLNEADVDCGGVCPLCSIGDECRTNNDCGSNKCEEKQGIKQCVGTKFTTIPGTDTCDVACQTNGGTCERALVPLGTPPTFMRESCEEATGEKTTCFCVG